MRAGASLRITGMYSPVIGRRKPQPSGIDGVGFDEEDDRFRIGLLSLPTGNLVKNVRDDLRELGDSF
jgi:hypothetical protein